MSKALTIPVGAICALVLLIDKLAPTCRRSKGFALILERNPKRLKSVFAITPC
ncbi:hypothetical protein D3C73_888120 [compost metagenome]